MMLRTTGQVYCIVFDSAIRTSAASGSLSLYTMLFGRDWVKGERSWLAHSIGDLRPRKAPYLLPKAVDAVDRHSARILAALLDLPPTLQDRIGDLVRLAATPVLRTRQKYIFQYIFHCECNSQLRDSKERMARLVEAAVGAKAQVEPALELEEGSHIMEKFMGRKPFTREIRSKVYRRKIGIELLTFQQ